MPDPTRMQWRCLVAYHRHHGNRKRAGADLFPDKEAAFQQWLVGFHLRAMCSKLGFQDLSDASLFYADKLNRELVRPRQRRTSQNVD